MGLARVLRDPQHVCLLSDTCQRCAERLYRDTNQGTLPVRLTCNIYKGIVFIEKMLNDRVQVCWNEGQNHIRVKPCALSYLEEGYVSGGALRQDSVVP